MERFDVVIAGAGAAGLFCAGVAGQRGLRVLLIDHADKVAEKIRISGGGRCNFTNRDVGPANFLSDNPAFCRSALARYTPQDFIALVQRHGIAFHEKHRGQLFCDDSAERLIALLLEECGAGGVQRWQPCKVHGVRSNAGAGRFALDTDNGPVCADSLVIATGGLSIPKIGATDFGYRIARQFGHRVIDPRPALVPLTFDPASWQAFTPLAGLSCAVQIEAGGGATPRGRFNEDLLFTHRGLSGPAVLQASSFWRAGEPLRIAFAEEASLQRRLQTAKASSRRQLGNELALHLPQRLSETWLSRLALPADVAMPQVRDKDLARLAQSLAQWQPLPSGSEGWRKAEVTAGGVDTRELSSQTMESKLVPGLHFIGEVVDVTGWLGGYNFQWAWAGAWACAQGLAATLAIDPNPG
ncbi:MAG TPA: NAD(P)/FAD-dependent oxidoreductase [Rubrivivax sp.]